MHPALELWGGGQRTSNPPFWTEGGMMVWNNATDLLDSLHKRGGPALDTPFKIDGLFIEVLKKGFWLKRELQSLFRSLKGSCFNCAFGLSLDNWTPDSPLNCWLCEELSLLRICCKSGPFKRKLERSDLLEENMESDCVKSFKGENGSSLKGTELGVGKRSDVNETGLSSDLLQRGDG